MTSISHDGLTITGDTTAWAGRVAPSRTGKPAALSDTSVFYERVVAGLGVEAVAVPLPDKLVRAAGEQRLWASPITVLWEKEAENGPWFNWKLLPLWLEADNIFSVEEE